MPVRSAATNNRAGTIACVLAALLAPGCDDVLGLDELYVVAGSTASSSGAGGSGGAGEGGGGGSAGAGGAVDSCGTAPHQAKPLVTNAKSPLSVALGDKRVFWTEAPGSSRILRSAEPCGEHDLNEAFATAELLPHLAAWGDDACWVLRIPRIGTLQCVHLSDGGAFANRKTAVIGDVVMTPIGVYWAEKPDEGNWRIMHATSAKLDGVTSVYSAEAGVVIGPLAASNSLIAWAEHHGIDGRILTAPLSAAVLDLDPPALSAMTEYEDLAAFGHELLVTNGKTVEYVNKDDTDLSGQVFITDGNVRQVAFGPGGERFALGSTAPRGSWSVIQLDDDAPTPLVSGIADAPSFAVGADAVYYVSATENAVFRYAR